MPGPPRVTIGYASSENWAGSLGGGAGLHLDGYLTVSCNEKVARGLRGPVRLLGLLCDCLLQDELLIGFLCQGVCRGILVARNPVHGCLRVPKEFLRLAL